MRINDATNNSQFMPALDFDAYGDLIVTFYDRRNEYDPNKKRYELYMAKIDSDGNLREPNQRISPFQSDPDFYTDSTGRAKFIGDYRDMWIESFSGTEYYLPVWIGIPYFGDAYISLIHP